MKICESYFISEVESNLRYQSDNVTDDSTYSSKAIDLFANNYSWNARKDTIPENYEVSLNQVKSEIRPPLVHVKNHLISPPNETTNLPSDITCKIDLKMSDSLSIKDNENSSDDIEDLLSLKVSKDYINCVWTNEPQNSKTKSSEKLVITDANALADDADQNKAGGEKQLEIPVKIVPSKPIKRKKPASRAKGNTVASVKKANVKAKEKLSKKVVQSPLKSDSGSFKIASLKKQNKNSKELCEETGNTTSVKIPDISSKALLDPNSIRPDDISNGSLFIAFKSLIIQRTIPPYKPKQYDTRFFNGSFFDCKACGDKFVLESSLTCHMRRRTCKFSYKCPGCKTEMLFYNRCCLMVHIMSHGMNVTNLHPEELHCLPLTEDESECESMFKHTSSTSYRCPECLGPVSSLKSHFQGIESIDSTLTNEVTKIDSSLKCKKCTYILPTKCSLNAHERFHMMKAPYLCPDCGVVFLNPSILYNHMEEECLHHLKCSIFECDDCKYKATTHNSFVDHLVANHLQRFFVCHICGDKIDSLQEFNKHRLCKHKLPGVEETSEIASLCARVECDKCPDFNSNLDSLQDHAASHASDYKFMKTVFQCKTCKLMFSNRNLLLSHKPDCKGEDEAECSIISSDMCAQELPENVTLSVKAEPSRGVSNSDQMLIEKSAPVLLSKISSPGNENSQNNHEKSSCNKANGSEEVCVPDDKCSQSLQNPEKEAICKLCKKVVSVGVDKAALKKHFSTFHSDIFLNAVRQEGNCRSLLKTISTRSKEAVNERDRRAIENFLICMKNNDFTKTDNKTFVKKKMAAKVKNLKKSAWKDKTARAKVSRFECYKCFFKSDDSVSFNTHILSHKSNQSDLQCPECGLCFIVSPPLEKHLIVGHSIKNVKKYLIDHGFQDRTSDAEEEVVDVETVDTEELQENQCTVCRQKFENALMLQKHFRVHGGAFLLAKLKARQST